METKHLTMNDSVYYNGKPVRLNDLWQDFLQGLQTKSPENHQGKHVIWDLRSEKLAPIEISEDILLKSNFKKATTYDEGEFYYSKEDSEYYYNIRMCYRPTKNQWKMHKEDFIEKYEFKIQFNKENIQYLNYVLEQLKKFDNKVVNCKIKKSRRKSRSNYTKNNTFS